MTGTCLLETLGAHLEVPALQHDITATFRYHHLTDADLSTVSPVILLRRSGTGGDDDDIAQQIDIDVIIIVGPDALKRGEDLTHTLRRFLKSDDGMIAEGTYGYTLQSHIIGPVQLQNQRHRFMFMVRCFTETQ